MVSRGRAGATARLAFLVRRPPRWLDVPLARPLAPAAIDEERAAVGEQSQREAGLTWEIIVSQNKLLQKILKRNS